MRAIFLAILFNCAGAAAGAGDYSFTGFARDLDTGAPLYVESHHVTAAGTAQEQRVVMYRCDEQSAPFARKQLRYGAARIQPAFDFVDARSGIAESLRPEAGGWRVSSREGAGADTRTRAIKADATLVADAGFDEFVRIAWDRLDDGEPLQVPFLVPSRLGSVDFRVRKVDETRIDGVAANVYRLSLAGPLGWFLPDIEVSYARGERRLLRYRGLGNIRDADGALLEVQIDFPASGRSAAPVDFAPLLATPLAPCGS